VAKEEEERTEERKNTKRKERVQKTNS